MSKFIQNIECKNDQSDFQKQLSRDTAKIKADNKMFIPADKTNNFYRLSSDSYSQLINTTITKSYKKTPSSAPNQIILEGKKIATDLNLDSRMTHCPQKALSHAERP